MKVSIKNLHITFMGQGEPLSETPPKEFYSPLERELRASLESERIAAKMYQKAAERLSEECTKIEDALNASREARESLRNELAQIKGWCNEYDEGKWPDHNAKGLGNVAAEVLHMMRDLWADLETRPLQNELLNAFGELFDENEKANHPQWPGSPMRLRCANLLNRPNDQLSGWNAPAPAQPFDLANPVSQGVFQPETPQTQPAGLESAQEKDKTAYINATGQKCPGFGCDSLLTIGQTYCSGDECTARWQPQQPVEPASAPQLPTAVEYDAQSETFKAAAMGEPEPTYSVCRKEGCDEPRDNGRIYCRQHRKP